MKYVEELCDVTSRGFVSAWARAALHLYYQEIVKHVETKEAQLEYSSYLTTSLRRVGGASGWFRRIQRWIIIIKSYGWILAVYPACSAGRVNNDPCMLLCELSLIWDVAASCEHKLTLTVFSACRFLSFINNLVTFTSQTVNKDWKKQKLSSVWINSHMKHCWPINECQLRCR